MPVARPYTALAQRSTRVRTLVVLALAIGSYVYFRRQKARRAMFGKKR